MADLDKDTVKEFLESEDGKPLLEDYIQKEKEPVINKNQELLDELKQYKSEVSKYKEFGDPDTLAEIVENHKKAKTEAEKAQEEKMKEEGKFHELEEHLRNQIQEKDETLRQFQNRVAQEQAMSSLRQTIQKHEGIPELLEPAAKERIRAEYDGDGVSISVLDKDGNTMFKDGKEATLDDLIAEFRSNDTYHRAFNGTGNSGTGTRPSNGPKKQPTDVVLDPKAPGYSLAKAMEYYKQNPEAYYERYGKYPK